MTIPEERLRQIANRFAELEARLASGQLEGDTFVAASRDYAELEPVAKAAAEVAQRVAKAEVMGEIGGAGGTWPVVGRDAASAK